MTNLIAVRDLTAADMEEIFRLAKRLKKRRVGQRPLAGKTLGLLFQKPSLRTRISFEVGMTQLGGSALYIGPVELQQGQREQAKDLGRVLSRYLDGIVARTFSHQEVEELARWATVPVINGLSDFSHPCQALTDLFTVWERMGVLRGVKIAYVGDGNNVCHSLMAACALMGVHLSIATPSRYAPDPEVIRWSLLKARRSHGKVELLRSPEAAVKGAQVVYTDVWTSMGQEKQRSRRLIDLKGYQVNRRLMRRAAEGAVFMHCLPAHRGEEVTDEVMDSKEAIVYDQAENRLHVQKAILLMLLGAR